jgi:hypothetical protein
MLELGGLGQQIPEMLRCSTTIDGRSSAAGRRLTVMGAERGG